MIRPWESVVDYERESLFLSWLRYASDIKNECAVHMMVEGRKHSFWLDANQSEPWGDRLLLSASMGSYGFPDDFGSWLRANLDLS